MNRIPLVKCMPYACEADRQKNQGKEEYATTSAISTRKALLWRKTWVVLRKHTPLWRKNMVVFENTHTNIGIGKSIGTHNTVPVRFNERVDGIHV